MNTHPRTAFQMEHPTIFFLDPTQPEALSRYLHSNSLLGSGEALTHVSKAGDGNMNCTVRVATSQRSFIVKQSRPWVEKYPQFSAPWDRAIREIEFYQLIQPFPALRDAMPRLLFADPAARLLIFEDLGIASDYCGLYRGERLTHGVIQTLAQYLGELHSAWRNTSEHPPLANREMRVLNHQHIYELPLHAEHGLQLDTLHPGFAEIGARYRSDRPLSDEITRIGRDVYLADGPCLLHGDFFPGSWLSTPAGPRVIDPEFGFFGFAEVDVGVWLGHLLLARQPASTLRAVVEAYPAPPGFSLRLAKQIAGIEVIRRLLGYAQLPLPYGLPEKAGLLEQARAWVLTDPPI